MNAEKKAMVARQLVECGIKRDWGDPVDVDGRFVGEFFEDLIRGRQLTAHRASSGT
jgi:hypothetical protein